MTHSIHIDQIKIKENRQRKEFEAESLTDLANSIYSLGLLHAPVLRVDGDDLYLVAGERRLRALDQLWIMGQSIKYNGEIFPPYHIPYVTLGDLSELEAEEAELDENLRRVDLTWQERSAAVGRLHALRLKQAEAVGETHSVADTARELNPDYADKSLGYKHAEVRTDIILAEHLNNNLVSKAKNPKEAIKALRKAEDMRKSSELAIRIGRTFNSSVHELYHKDCLEYLSECPDNTFDVICTDPPYGMNAQNFQDAGGMLSDSDHQYDDSPESWNILMQKFVKLAYKVSKPQAHAYIFCDIDNFHALKSYMVEAGWYVFRTPIINYKPRSGRIPLPEHGPKRQWEMCLYAIKGRKPVTGIFSDVISTVLTEDGLKHGAQKPVELYIELLKRSVKPGDVVLDAFAGTGTIFPAAHALKCKAIGIEQEASYYGIAIKRLNDLDAEPALL